MSRSKTCLLALLCSSGLVSAGDRACSGDDVCERISLLFEGPSEFRGTVRHRQTAIYDAIIDPGSGASGWSLSMSTDGGLSIVDITTVETAGGEAGEPPGLRVAGFEKSELARRADGVVGAVSSVVLSAFEPIVLPEDDPVVICKLTVEAKFSTTLGEASARVRYLDGLSGSGRSVDNAISIDRAFVKPTLNEKRVRVTTVRETLRRGDSNSDGVINISDSIFVLGYLFLGGRTPPCLDAADIDDNGKLDITDGHAINVFLFLGGTTPAAPGPWSCGTDPTEDELTCATPNCQ